MRLRRLTFRIVVVLAATFSPAVAWAGTGSTNRLPAQRHSETPNPTDSAVRFGKLGDVRLIKSQSASQNLVIFISGDGGWEPRVESEVNAISAAGASVAVVDMRSVRAGYGSYGHSLHCSYPAGDFEELAKLAEKKLGFSAYVRPVIAGYSSGATFAYALVAQAPSGTFRGAISLGFCPDVVLGRAPCKYNQLQYEPLPVPAGAQAKPGQYLLQPSKDLQAPWAVLRGEGDKECTESSVQNFVSAVPSAKLVELKHVGHGFGAPENWMDAYKEAFAEMTGPAKKVFGETGELSDLPLSEVPAPESSGDTLAVIFTGDGGWAEIDRSVAEALAKHGVPAVGLSTLSYFWDRKTPEESTAALAKIMEHYLAKWQKSKVILVGYSYGADLLVPLTARLPKELQEKTALLALLGPSTSVDFEMHIAYWVGATPGGEIPLGPELPKLKNIRTLCLYGEEDSDGLCATTPKSFTSSRVISGGHHFGGDYEKLATLILEAAK